MSSTGTKRSRSRGTQNSTRSQTSKAVNHSFISATKTGKISKYFAKVTKDNSDESESSCSLSESPYKNCLSEVKNVKLDDSAGDLDDFKTPRAINKVSKIVNAKPPCKNVKKRKKTQVPLTKFVKDNFRHIDVNVDHLQMALALSKSSYEAENPDRTPSSQEKKDSFREAFEKFGFGYNKNRISVEQKKEKLDTVKKNKKSRYRYVTPILKLRTKEERESLISSKVSLILAQNQRMCLSIVQKEHELFSPFLQKFTKRKIFMINNMELEQLNVKGRFYVQGFEPSAKSLCGCLLKDWRSIPGREPTPEREKDAIGDDITSPNVPKFLQSYLQIGKENLEPDQTSPFRIHSTQPSPWNSLCARGSPNFICGSLSSYGSREEDITLEKRNSQIINLNNSDESSNENKNSERGISIDCETTKANFGAVYDEEVTSYVPESDSFLTACGEITRKSRSPVVELVDVNNGENFSMQREDYPISSEILPNISCVISPDKATSSPICCRGKLNFSVQIHDSPNPCLSSQTSANPSYQDAKQSRDCISPDLFESEDYQELSRNNEEKMESVDLTESDSEECTDFHLNLNLSAPRDSLDQNVTKYVNNLLTTNETPPPQKLEKICTVDDNSQQNSCSQESIYISDDEVNYSSVFNTPLPEKKVQYDISDDEEFGISNMDLSLSERLRLKNRSYSTPKLSDLSEAVPSNEISNNYNSSPLTACSPQISSALETFNSPLQQVPTSNKRTELENFFTLKQEMETFGSKPPKRNKTSPPRKLEKISTSEDDSEQESCSQESISIRDDEVNYSSVYGTPHLKRNLQCDSYSDDEEFGFPNMELSLSERLKLKNRSYNSPKISELSEAGPSNEISNHDAPLTACSPQMSSPHETFNSPFQQVFTNKKSVELEDSFTERQEMETPNKSSIIVKTENVTPMANYDEMNTPQVCKELDKFGLKPLKRSKGAKLLKYIYEATHPIVKDEDGKVVKKRRTNQFEDIISDVGEEEELIFERTQSKRILSCRLPLHIAWHNLVMSNPKIREDILLYEPLQLEDVHLMLKEQGYKYNIKDLLTFLDKKCITIRTAQGQRNIGKKL
ncbi:uncharacterized protein LOC123011896 [Tribolium madens]|uniref:uncharacterized protein LOC123011896 n=1 Tax=Tribolium madens TaxID=41895 RepID=UPI001CF738D8|nr:uncharacterized protein LOC123011896 [Tribolium madens]